MRKVGYGHNMTFPRIGVSKIKSLSIDRNYKEMNQQLATFLIASNSSGQTSPTMVKLRKF